MTQSPRRQIGPAEVADALARLGREVAEACRQSKGPILMAGIADGGLTFGRRLAACVEAELGRSLVHGRINIMFHRDDIGANPIPDPKNATELPVNPDGATVILADDVIFSGRTVRAALNELFENGRPKRVFLAVLIDRGHRCLPIQPDFTGIVIDTERDARVRVTLAEDDGDDTVRITPPKKMA